ncbi:Ribosomal RNA methyltransferase RrmJ/FtsJ [Ascosphaera apis ARSEF 7405]|uniref:Ribosomal RNA methyltransferase RrmJ/FtsJ n=1 Tax=Ascosphaera apis ARSEF 7405 TaxID=392613 RepID=A0A167XPR6_9EURO|nr:Ribosomal RNA methyltransferase RrmJ/FtsJ [Ascosphaera apis ARSEF 7405]
MTVSTAEPLIESSSSSKGKHQKPGLLFFQEVKDFYIEHDTENVFKELNELCEKCWQDPRGDAWFEERRKCADTADVKERKNFYNMMLQIGIELESKTQVFTRFHKELGSMGQRVKILDLCMAPGGYTASALKYLPLAKACGLTLPVNMGGHPVLLYKAASNIEYLDLTMLIHEIMAPWDEDTDITDYDGGGGGGGGVDAGSLTFPEPAPEHEHENRTLTVPSDHPDIANFSTARPFRNMQFNLIFCDGQVLRTHPRSPYREKVEARRLLISQAIIALQRLVPEGGTMVVLLHRLENPYTVQFLYLFSRFADIELFKPAKKHAIRSSFYLIARNIRARSPEALEALGYWKRVWWNTTFEEGEMNALEMAGSERPSPIADITNEAEHVDEKFDESIERQKKELLHILDVFGEKLIELARPLWRIQIAAMNRMLANGFEKPWSVTKENRG